MLTYIKKEIEKNERFYKGQGFELKLKAKLYLKVAQYTQNLL